MVSGRTTKGKQEAINERAPHPPLVYSYDIDKSVTTTAVNTRPPRPPNARLSSSPPKLCFQPGMEHAWRKYSGYNKQEARRVVVVVVVVVVLTLTRIMGCMYRLSWSSAAVQKMLFAFHHELIDNMSTAVVAQDVRCGGQTTWV